VAEAVAGPALRPGLRVMISAGAAGIGRATAAAFAAAGAKVHICDVDEQALAACLAEVAGVAGVPADVADDGQVGRWFDAARDALGGLDVMVNNAGIAGPTGPIESLDAAEWRRTIEVNLTSMYLCCRRAVPLLKAAAAEHGEAVMVNLSSVAGRFGYAFRTPYSASKWAVVGLSKSLSRELGPFGIRVNAVQPGPVAGPRIERVIEAKAAAQGVSPDEIRAALTAHASLGRFVTADDIAGTILFLSSPQARNISGQAIAVCADSTDIT